MNDDHSGPSTSASLSPSTGPKCRAICHIEAANLRPSESAALYKTSNTRKFKKSVKMYMADHNLLEVRSDRTNYICQACLIFVESKLPRIDTEVADSKSEDAVYRPEVYAIVMLIEQGQLSQSEILRISKAIGTVARKEILLMASKSIAPDRMELAHLKTYTEAWEQNELQIFKAFVSSALDLGHVSFQDQLSTSRHLQKAAESLCRIVKPRFISHLALAENMVLHSFSGSKTACQILSSIQPSGSYQTMSNTIQKISDIEPCFPKGDIFIAFDNQQVVGREYRVSSGGKQRISTVTSLSVFQEKFSSNSQSTFDLPTIFEPNLNTAEEMWKRFVKFSENANQIHKSYRNTWISTRLSSVELELKNSGGDLNDPANKKLISSLNYEQGLQYDRVPECSSNCSVYDMANVMVNPNSGRTVKFILDQLLAMNEASDPTRKWFSVYCDGLPYGIASNIIATTYFCKTCQNSGTILELEAHTCSGEPNVARQYKKIILRPGAGHFEINFVRSIFAQYFDIFIRPIAYRIGFTTLKALEYCKSANDHHKTWQILQILFLALTDELIFLYLKSKPENETGSLDGFGIWKDSQKSKPNLNMACDFVFNFLHPLFLFRASIRRCNDNVSQAALHKLSSIFFGFNHPKYQQIVAKDLFFLLSLPQIGSPVASRNSFRMNNSAAGQGLDFLLEERNREQKHWTISQGPPTEKQWRKASGSLTFFEKMRADVLKNLEITPDHEQSHHIQFGEEYLMARDYYRNAFQNIGPSLTTFCEEASPLPIQFINCAYTCQENKLNYFRSFLRKEKCILNLVETRDLQKLSPEQLRKVVQSKIRQLPASWRSNFNSILNDPNCKLIDILGELEDIIAELNYNFIFEKF